MSREQQPALSPEVGGTSLSGGHQGESGASQHSAGNAALHRILVDNPESPGQGQGGVITETIQVTLLSGHTKVLPEGTYVEVKSVQGHQLLCEIGSAIGGQAMIPRSVVHYEPLLARGETGAEASESHSYMRHTGALWHGAPKVDDVAQGMLGDCYVVAALGAIVANDPQAIVGMFDPPRDGMPQYRIRLYVPGPGGYTPEWFTVDTYLPTYGIPLAATRKRIERYHAAYGTVNHSTNDVRQPRWPALVEKAIAQAHGGYHRIGTGGPSSDIMQMVLGRPARDRPLPGSDAALLEYLRKAQREGLPVTCGSQSQMHSDGQGGFTKNGNDYVATFNDGPKDKTVAREILPGTLVIRDVHGHAPTAQDNHHNLIAGGGATGSVDYEGGSMAITYPSGKEPASPNDLRAKFDYRGLVDPARRVYAWHAYIFVAVDAQDRIVLRNPWGHDHPEPLTIAQFRADFPTLFGLDETPTPMAANTHR